MFDHGEMLGDHGIYLKGQHFCDEVILDTLQTWDSGGKPDDLSVIPPERISH